MKKVLVTLVVLLAFSFPTKLLAQPFICQVGAVYSDRIELSDGVTRGQVSGHKILVFMRTMPGIDETQITRVVFKHVANDGKITIFRPDIWCDEPWPTIVGPCGAAAERMWLVPLAFRNRWVGKWVITVKDTFGAIEKRRFFVDYFAIPLPPQNFYIGTDGNGQKNIEWDASVGPPEFGRDPSSPYTGTYRVEMQPPGMCAQQERLQTSDADVSMWWFNPTTNRIGVRLPLHWVGNRVRVSNIVRDGGFNGYPDVTQGLDDYIRKGPFSRGLTIITLH